jgi:hypothetical protein
MFDYFDVNSVTFENLIVELKEDVEKNLPRRLMSFLINRELLPFWLPT